MKQRCTIAPEEAETAGSALPAPTVAGADGDGDWRRRVVDVARRLGRDGLALLFPPRCGLCGEALPTLGDALCVKCAALLEGDCTPRACPGCGANQAPHAADDARCPRCNHRGFPIDGVVRLGVYGPALGELVSRFKFNARAELMGLFGPRLAARVAAAGWIGEVEAVTPVPTTWWRRMRRRLHAPTEVAALVARRTGRPMVGLLRRIRGGPSQVGLTFPQRVQNVRGAFAMMPGVRLNGARLLLVDDVATSGATMMECARVLRRAGAAKVFVAIIARADRSADLVRP